MQKRTRDKLIAVLAVIAAAISLYLAFGRRSQKIDLGPYDVLGVVTAEESARLIGNTGQVLVMAPDSGGNKNPSVEAELKSFQQTIQKQKGMSAVAEKINMTPMMAMATGGGVPADQFFKALERHPGVGALVLFFGFPTLSEPELAALKKIGVKTVVVSSFRAGYPRLMEQQVLHLAIAPRSDTPPPGAPEPRSLRERFDQDYTIITPADAARSR